MATINQPSLKPYSFFICFLIVIIPIWLGDLYFASRVVVPNAKSHQPEAPTAPDVALDKFGSLDRKMFLRNFENQAGVGLIDCLRESLGAHGSVTILARLSQKGKISAVRFLNPTTLKLDCAKQAIEEMDFEGVGNSLSDSSLEIRWRFDW